MLQEQVSYPEQWNFPVFAALSDRTHLVLSLHHQCAELRDNIGNLLFEKAIFGGTPSFVTLYPGQTLYSKALDNFRGKLYFKYLGEVIATNFGVGDEVSVLIQALLEDENYSVRRDAACALGEIGDARAVEPLIQALLEDENPYVRARAAWALGEIGDTRAIEALTQALEDENSSVRLQAEKALEKIQGE